MDYYKWAKERIKFYIERINEIKNQDGKISPGKIWSVKKLLALDYYIHGFVTIMKKQPIVSRKSS